MKRLLLLLPLAGCPRGGDATPKAPPGEVYAGLFEQQRQWTYTVSDDLGDGTEPAGYEVSCQVTDTAQDGDTRVSYVLCDGTFGEGMQEAVGGLWVATADGVWYLPELIPADDEALQAPPADALVPQRRILPATPVASPTDTRTADGWCHDDNSLADGASWAKICFSGGGVSSGELGWDEGPHRVTFKEVTDEE